MKSFKFITFILVIFLKTGNVLSQDSIFNVNNIEIIKKTNTSNQDIANQAIKKAYLKLIDKILLIALLLHVYKLPSLQQPFFHKMKEKLL